MQLQVLGHAYALDCQAAEQKRLEDLAKALNVRLAGLSGEPDAMRRLVLTALALMDEAQASGAALARARAEIERLTDMVVEARLEAAAGEPEAAVRGQVAALNVAHGRA